MNWEVNDLAEVSRGIIFHTRLNGRKQNILNILGLFLSHCSVDRAVGRTSVNVCSALPNTRYSNIHIHRVVESEN